MWKLYLLDKAAYQVAVTALDKFFQGDPSLLTPLVERCLAQLRSDSAELHRLNSGSKECLAQSLERAMAGGDTTDLPGIVINLTAMPDFQDTLRYEHDSPNLVEWGDHDALLYATMRELDPWVGELILERVRHDLERYADGLSMFLFKREDLVRLRSVLCRVVEGPGSQRGLGVARDRFIALIDKCLADESTAVAFCDFG